MWLFDENELYQKCREIVPGEKHCHIQATSTLHQVHLLTSDLANKMFWAHLFSGGDRKNPVNRCRSPYLFTIDLLKRAKDQDLQSQIKSILRALGLLPAYLESQGKNLSLTLFVLEV